MECKEVLINQVLQKVSDDFDRHQLRKIKLILTIQLKEFRVERQTSEVIIYDENGDASAYRQFFVSKKIQGLAQGTLTLCMQTINRFMRAVRKSYSEINTNDIRLFIANREMMDGLSKATLARERGCIVRFFHWLHVEQYIDHDPGARVEKIQVPKRKKREFSALEVEKIRDATKTAKETLVVELLLSTGCRVSELVSLSFEKYDQETQSIEVIGKVNKQRSVYLNAKAVLALANYLEEVPHHSGPLFYGQAQGEMMTAAGVQKLVRRLGDRAGVSNVHPHRFRRTAATFARRNGMQLELVRDFLGHADINTTLLYSMTNDSELRQSHQKYVN